MADVNKFIFRRKFFEIQCYVMFENPQEYPVVVNSFAVIKSTYNFCITSNKTISFGQCFDYIQVVYSDLGIISA